MKYLVQYGECKEATIEAEAFTWIAGGIVEFFDSEDNNTGVFFNVEAVIMQEEK